MNKNIKRSVIVAVVFVVSYLLLVFSTKVKKGFTDIQKSFDDDLSPTYPLASKDSEIVVKSHWSKLKVKETMHFRDRSAVFQLTYETKYILAITKINAKEDDLLKDLESDTILSTERTVGKVYSIINLTNN